MSSAGTGCSSLHCHLSFGNSAKNSGAFPPFNPTSRTGSLFLLFYVQRRRRQGKSQPPALKWILYTVLTKTYNFPEVPAVSFLNIIMHCYLFVRRTSPFTGFSVVVVFFYLKTLTVTCCTKRMTTTTICLRSKEKVGHSISFQFP